MAWRAIAEGPSRPVRQGPHFTWDSTATVPLLLDDGTHRYLYGPGPTPYAQVNDQTGAIDYLHADSLGTVRLITDATGAVAASNTYDAYGTLTHHTGSASSAIGYTGNWADPTTGLIYLRARDYDPTTAQFLTVDPAITSTHQPYAYAGNNPVQNTDPLGLCYFCLSGALHVLEVVSGYDTVKSFSNCTNSDSIYDCAVMNFDPAYYVVQGFGNEWRDAEHNCSGWTIFEDAAEGVAAVAATGALAVGGAAAINSAGIFSSAESSEGGYLRALFSDDTGAVNPGDPVVNDILKGKLGSIKNAPLPAVLPRGRKSAK